ncbi:type III-B CRISPR-associated protein Cas10/Cmr2 [Sulfurovum sp.]|jgi:CRISPR-associated protein Cmr2|uniref:type III-B CRISPR-associated protein Cas10/Cmr2 n=1 Tax=Sulfurovum sp. TaxID=1969726 RepID=UPI002A3631F7|nr:type III-B CRISPR-associated protein Cas10/Cmr2 [Sulfurovum sp.]MDY0403677.1 type III-B CRISPR-associated protein Cas10/Cmr2 [Sulfurovum sp.]
MRYIALTIGPIVDTLSLGRKTAEVWMASYLFSSFMKNSIKKIKERSDAIFVVPYVNNDILQDQDNGVGMFHDRFILTSETLSLKDVEEILQEQKDELAVMISESIKRDTSKVKEFLSQYLQTYLFETTETFDNPVLDISKIMDSLEWHTPILESEEDYLRLFLNRDTILNSSLAKLSFGRKPSFRALDEISQGDSETFENASRYIAIIYADGDNLGEYIKKQKDVTQVSKKLFDFDQKAVETIESYDAVPIFVGGDDLIIFAPLLNNGETVFELMARLSKDYKDTLKTEESTLSFGISFTYYKYPLYEALERARNALFDTAKKYDGKNAVALSAEKHSGQTFEFCIGKNEEAYRVFSELTKKILTEKVELPHAVHHKLEGYQKVFETLPENRIESTFENLFNEDLHKSKFKEGLSEVSLLMKSLGTGEKAQEKLFSMLSTIKVLRGDR